MQKIIGGHTVKQGKNFEESLHRQNGKSMLCSTKPLLWCAQIVNTQAFMSQQTKITFNIFHKPTCKSKYVSCLMECIICKIQCVGKSKTPFN